MSQVLKAEKVSFTKAFKLIDRKGVFTPFSKKYVFLVIVKNIFRNINCLDEKRKGLFCRKTSYNVFRDAQMLCTLEGKKDKTYPEHIIRKNLHFYRYSY